MLPTNLAKFLLRDRESVSSVSVKCLISKVLLNFLEWLMHAWNTPVSRADKNSFTRFLFSDVSAPRISFFYETV